MRLVKDREIAYCDSFNALFLPFQMPIMYILYYTFLNSGHFHILARFIRKILLLSSTTTTILATQHYLCRLMLAHYYSLYAQCCTLKLSLRLRLEKILH